MAIQAFKRNMALGVIGFMKPSTALTSQILQAILSKWPPFKQWYSSFAPQRSVKGLAEQAIDDALRMDLLTYDDRHKKELYVRTSKRILNIGNMAETAELKEVIEKTTEKLSDRKNAEAASAKKSTAEAIRDRANFTIPEKEYKALIKRHGKKDIGLTESDLDMDE